MGTKVRGGSCFFSLSGNAVWLFVYLCKQAVSTLGRYLSQFSFFYIAVFAIPYYLDSELSIGTDTNLLCITTTWHSNCINQYVSIQ